MPDRIKKLNLIMEVNSLLKGAKKVKHRMKVSFTFDAELYTKFQILCDQNEVAQSRLLEEMIKVVVEKT